MFDKVFFFFFLKSCSIWETLEEYGTANQATDDNIMRRREIAIFFPDN